MKSAERKKDSYQTMKVVPRPGEPLPKVLKRFKRLCEEEGIMKDFRRHEYYESPSQKRRRKKMAAFKRLQKELEREQEKKIKSLSEQGSDTFDLYIPQ